MAKNARLGLLLLCMACGHVSPYPAPLYFVQVYYKNSTGEDLLDPLTAGHLDGDKVRISDLVSKNGKIIETPATINVTDSCRSFFCRSPRTGDYYLEFLPNPGYEGTLIHFGSVINDTLSYETKPVYSGLGITKVLHMGKELWSASPNSTNVLKMTIVK